MHDREAVPLVVFEDGSNTGNTDKRGLKYDSIRVYLWLNYCLETVAAMAVEACWTRGAMMSSPADFALPLYCSAKLGVVLPGFSNRMSMLSSSFALMF